jgi:hypothetical protein
VRLPFRRRSQTGAGGKGPFDPVALRLLAVLAGASLLTGLLAAVFTTPSAGAPSAAPDGYSVSALGHRAFADLLRELGFSVTLRRSAGSPPTQEGSVLVVAEPDLQSEAGRKERLEQMLDEAHASLLVLPKWRAVEDPEHPGWIQDALPVSEHAVNEVLSAAGVKATVVRLDQAVADWSCEASLPAPTLRWPQLVSSAALEPLISSPEGILLARLPGDARQRLLLTDPDVLATHGLGNGDNAELIASVIELLAGQRGAVSLDETLHGHSVERSLWRELASFPLVLVVVQALLVAGLLLWATLGRFGPAEHAPPALPPGTQALLDNTASLLLEGRHEHSSLRRYLDDAEQTVTERLRVAGSKEREQRAAALERLSAARGLPGPRALREQVTAATGDKTTGGRRVLEAATNIHHWKTEMLRGTR